MNANRRPMSREEYLRAAARTMTERQLLDGILGTPRKPGLALALGWRGYHTHRSQHSPAGYPDLTLVNADVGRIVFAELKTEKGKTTPEQDEWLEDLGRIEHEERIDLASRDLEDFVVPTVTVYLWRPSDLLEGRVEAALRGTLK